MVRITALTLLLSALWQISNAQQLTHDRMATYAYEDMGDWLRRLHGIYALDYGVAGAPMVLRPWGMNSWNVGVERDGIPWHRVSDGLYESNLDSPEEYEMIELVPDGLSPFSTIRLQSKWLPSDTATTDVQLREGYYGFGRVDFAHAQKLNRQLTAEVRGRLFWYDGLRSEINNLYSKSRFYNLSGKFKHRFGNTLAGTIEYGGSNVEARSPIVILESGNLSRPTIENEREYGTASFSMHREHLQFDFGLHARQDRETRIDPNSGHKFFGLRERFWYGYGEVVATDARGRLSGRIAGESSEFEFVGSGKRAEDAISAIALMNYDLKLLSVSGSALVRKILGNETERETDLTDKSLSFEAKSASVNGISLTVEGSAGQKALPQFWRYARFPIRYRPLLVSDEFATNSYYGGKWGGFEANYNFASDQVTWAAGVDWRHGSGNATLQWREVQGNNARFLTENDTTYLYSTVDTEWIGPEISYDLPLTNYLRMQSWSTIQCDKKKLSRALDTRSFSRLIYSQDFFKAPLHVDTYVAYELIGRHRSVSDVESKVLGPAHLVHFRIEGSIEGVTLIWGTENITGQHYEYLPGYMLIRKEEYFGLKWTLKL